MILHKYQVGLKNNILVFLKDGKISNLFFVNKMIFFSFNFVDNKGLLTRLITMRSKMSIRIFKKRMIVNLLLNKRILLLIKMEIK